MSSRSRNVAGAALLLLAACSGASKGGAPTSGGAAGASGTAGTGSGGSAAGGSASAGSGGGAAGMPGTNDAGASGSGGTTPDVGAGASGGGGAGGGAAGTGAAGAGAGGLGGFGYSGASRCPNSPARLCESFENGLDDKIWTTLTSGEGTAVVDDTRAFRGTKSLHVKVVNQGHKAAISESSTFPLPGKVLYARMFIWFDTFTTMAHFTMMESPQTAAGAWIRFGGQFGKYGVGTDHGASGDWLQPDTAPVPTKQWTCIEVELDGGANQFHVWQDDGERTALAVGATQHKGFEIPAFTSLCFGWQTYSNQAPGEFWIDEIAIDDKPIGCAN
jgi:hypothetical protein